MRKPTKRAKWRSSMSAYRSVLENVLDTADIVRDRDVTPAMLLPERIGRHTTSIVTGITDNG